MSKTEKAQYIRDLEAKIEILQQENSQLAERGEDTLLLGLISEKINSINDSNTLIDWGLEHISILKDIPFCARGQLQNHRIVIKNYYYSASNSPLEATETELPEEICRKLSANPFQLSDADCQNFGSLIKFKPKEFQPVSLFFVPTKSKIHHQQVFCFAVTDSSARLTAMRHLLQRIVEIISSRIDNLTLMEELNSLNQSLDIIVQERTKELHDTNKVLRKSEAKFKSLFNDASDMIHFLDPSGKIIDANPVELETLQYSRDEFIGRSILDFIAPESKNNSAKALKGILTGKDITGLHTVMLAKDGSRVNVEVNAVPEIIDGKVIRTRAIIRNITERKQLEENQQKIKKLESVGILAGGIAHDFNNILAAILGNIDLAKLYTTPEDKIHPLLKEAQKASLRAKDLTQQLLTFAKGGEPVKEVTSITKVIEDSAQFVLRGSKLHCEFSFAEGLWPVEIDPGQISQVIQNLIINARQATSLSGHVEVVCENFQHEINNLPLKAGRYIKISIKDRGCGIPTELLDKIFDPYFTTKQEGSGLGLAITHSIIRKHQGHIVVESAKDKGTTFTIFLPATEPQDILEKKEPAIKCLAGQGKIVIMDDDKMVREITKAILSKFGYEVLQAINGAEAIEIYQNGQDSGNPIDIIIMDLTIPGGMGGKETAQEILKTDPKAKLIVSSGYSNDPVMANCQEYGFCAAIAKPFQIQDLLETVAKAISK